MMTKMWVVVEYGGDVGYTIVGGTNDEEYAESAVEALKLINKDPNKHYEMECIDYVGL